MVLPAATAPMTAVFLFHWLGNRVFEAPWARGVQREAVLVEGAQLAEVAAVGEGQVDGGVGAGIAEVVVGELGEDEVRQLAGRA